MGLLTGKNVKRTCTVAIAPFLAFLSLFVLFLFFLTTPPGERVLRRELERRLTRVAGMDIRIGSIETNLLSRIRINDFAMIRRDSTGRNTLLQVKHARADYDLTGLPGRTLRIVSIGLDSLVVDVERDTTGHVTVPFPATAPGGAGGESARSFGVLLGKAELSRAYFHYNDRYLPADLILHDLDLSIQSGYSDEYRFETTADSLVIFRGDGRLPVRDIRVRGFVDNRKISVESLMLGIPELDVTGHLSVDRGKEADSLSAKIQLRGSPSGLMNIVEEYLPAPLYPVDGNVDLLVNVQGTRNDPEIDVQVAMRDVQAGEFRMKHGAIRSSWAEKRLLIREMRFDMCRGRIYGSGTLNADSLLTHRFDIEVSDMDLAGLWHAFGRDSSFWGGKVNVHMESAGPVRMPEEIRVTSQLNLQHVTCRNRQVPGFDGEFIMQSGKAIFSLRQGTSRAGVELTVQDNNIEGDFHAHIDDVGLLAGLVDATGLKGSLRARGSIGGSMEDPEGQLYLALSDPAYRQFRFDSVEVALKLDSEHIQLVNVQFQRDSLTIRAWGDYSIPERSGSCRLAVHPLSIDGVNEKKGDVHFFCGKTHSTMSNCREEAQVRADFHMGKNEIISLEITGDGLDMENYLQVYSGSRAAKGTLDFGLTFSGMVPRHGADVWKEITGNSLIRGDFLLRDGEIHPGEDTPPIENIEISASLRDSVLNLHRIDGTIRETPFFISGKVQSRVSGDLEGDIAFSISDNAVIHGEGGIFGDSLRTSLRTENFQLSFLQPVLPDIHQLAGEVNSQIAITGAITNPVFAGSIDIRDLSFRPAGMGAAFSEGVLTARFDQDSAVVDTLVLHTNGGTLFAAGAMEHIRGIPTGLAAAVDIRDIVLRKGDQYLLTVRKADLHYGKDDESFILDGDIVLGETSLMYDLQPKLILELLEKTERPYRAPPEMLKRTRMNIRLRESEDVHIKNNLARLRLHPELSFTGTVAHPNISGRLTVEEGYVLYLDRKFDVQRGIFDFIDPHRLNPLLDLQARATVKSYRTLEEVPYTVTLTITGSADEAQVTLVSDPPLERADIIALLTVGATRQQLTGSDREGEGSVFGDVLQERVEMLSSQKISGYASRKIGDFLGLDEVSIEGNLFRSSSSRGPQLLASKRLSDRMKITYTTTVGHQNEQGIRLDYRLTEQFSLQGETDQRGRSGLDLSYRIKFE
jgi:hypothetical protein